MARRHPAQGAGKKAVPPKKGRFRSSAHNTKEGTVKCILILDELVSDKRAAVCLHYGLLQYVVAEAPPDLKQGGQFPTSREIILLTTEGGWVPYSLWGWAAFLTATEALSLATKFAAPKSIPYDEIDQEE